jgi:adenylate cyclase
MMLLKHKAAWLKQLVWEWRGVWITAPSVSVFVILVRFVGLFQFSEWAMFDHYMQMRPQLPRDSRVVIVGLDETDLKTIGQALVPDQIYAELIEKLKKRNPRAIGLDIYRDLPVPPGHQELIQVFKSTPNLVGIQKVVGDKNRSAVSAPPTLVELGQVGANDVVADADNTVRRGFVYLSNDQGEPVYSFSLFLALLYLEKAGIAPENIEGTDAWKLGNQLFKPLEPNEGGYVRAQTGGFQLIINYRGPSGSFNTVSMRDVLQDRVAPDWGKDAVILIGAVGESFNDLAATPYSGGFLSIPEPMAGVEIHANLVSQFLSAALNDRAGIQSWPEPLEWLWILGWATVGSILAWRWRIPGKSGFISYQRVGQLLSAIIILIGCTYFAFIWSWWIPLIPPLVALVGSTVAIAYYLAHTAGILRKTFGRYLSDEIVANLLESKQGLELGGKRQKITIMSSDLRGFTALSERLAPEDVVQILNIYFKDMLEVISAYHGVVDKFMGDGILVLFGVPATRENDAQRAIACAIAMQQAMKGVNEKMKHLGLTLEMGIGINTGECVVGNIGSEKHTEYTVIGSEINLTFRIETYTTGSQILISESTFKAADPSLLRVDGQKQVKPKGVKQPITIYDIGGLGEPYNLFLPKEEEVFFPIPEEIPILYMVVEGKQVHDTIFKGSLVKLSAKGAEVRVEKTAEDSMPPPLSNLKINLLRVGTRVGVSEDVYAKVLEKKTTDTRSFDIHFTFKPPSVAAIINILYQSVKH